MKRPFILYFVKGFAPKPEHVVEANSMNARVAFRNASVVEPDSSVEQCDGVAGIVPSAYSDFPTAEEAIAKYDEFLKAAAEKVGKVAPKPRKATKTASKPSETSEVKIDKASTDEIKDSAGWKAN